jgi:hypothetical protein
LIEDLPENPEILQQMVLDLMAQLDREFTERNKIEALLRELLNAGCIWPYSGDAPTR